jgi:hypothetical protein
MPIITCHSSDNGDREDLFLSWLAFPSTDEPEPNLGVPGRAGRYDRPLVGTERVRSRVTGLRGRRQRGQIHIDDVDIAFG